MTDAAVYRAERDLARQSTGHHVRRERELERLLAGFIASAQSQAALQMRYVRGDQKPRSRARRARRASLITTGGIQMEGHETPPSGEDKKPRMSAEQRQMYSDKMDMLSSAVSEKFAKKGDGGGDFDDYAWVCDFDDSTVIFCQNGEKYQAPYSVSGDAVKLGATTPVRAVMSYEPLETKSAPRRNQALRMSRERRRKERHRSIALLPEVRYFDPSRVEIRAEDGNDGHFLLSGSPIMYGNEYRVVDPWGEFEERIHVGSVTDILARGVDCRLLLNHGGLPMARTTSGTLDLWDTPDALRFKANLDARQQLANDFYIAIQRRDLDQMSVGMIVGEDKWGTEGSTETRDIYVLSDLLDVSGVTYPCSPTTSIAVAQRMAMQAPVESRARLRRLVANVTAGQRLEKDDIAALRSMLTPALDPGDETQTPEGTGRLGSPDGEGRTWANEGDLELPDATPDDGTEGIDATGGNAVAPPQDGTGSRSASPSRLTRIRVQRALRGL